jgi:methionyl-tRNA formyltransferase
MKKYLVAVAGTTQHTVQCATALFDSSEFEIAWVLTPQPKLLGRKHLLTANPLDQFAEGKNIPRMIIEEKIDQDLRSKIEAATQATPIDFLLVVDFGYLIPSWLLKLSKLPQSTFIHRHCQLGGAAHRGSFVYCMEIAPLL